MARDTAVLTQTVHLLVRLRLQVDGGGVRLQQRAQVVPDLVFDRRQLWPLQ